MEVENVISEYLSRCIHDQECRQLNESEIRVLTNVLRQFKRILEKPILIGSPRHDSPTD